MSDLERAWGPMIKRSAGYEKVKLKRKATGWLYLAFGQQDQVKVISKSEFQKNSRYETYIAWKPKSSYIAEMVNIRGEAEQKPRITVDPTKETMLGHTGEEPPIAQFGTRTTPRQFSWRTKMQLIVPDGLFEVVKSLGY